MNYVKALRGHHRYPDRVVTLEGHEYRIHAVQIIGTDHVDLSVWERCTLFDHSGLRFIDHECWGDITTRRSADVEKLPGGSPERIQLAGIQRAFTRELARQMINRAYPGLTYDQDRFSTTTEALGSYGA